jgi:hypothetical protein
MNTKDTRSRAEKIVDAYAENGFISPNPTERELAIVRVNRLLTYGLITHSEEHSASPPAHFEETWVGKVSLALFALGIITLLLMQLANEDKKITGIILFAIFFVVGVAKVVIEYRRPVADKKFH